jgi:class 3 adenylate cyclase
MDMTKKSTQFQDLLLDYSHETDLERRQQIEELLWQQYGSEQAILVLDMSGFCLLSRKYGIVHYLSMVRRMQLTVEPIVDSFEGKVIKFEADNCFAVFPQPLPAIRAAVALQLAFDASNLITSEDLDIHISCGIDYGKLLIVDLQDCFGEAVNRACKLGEDIGIANDILVTQEAMNLVPADADIKCKPLELSISGINITAYAIEYNQKQ